MNKLRLFFTTLIASMAMSMHAQVTPANQMEKLDRGLVAIHTSYFGKSVFLSWRLLGTDDKNATTFDLLRDGEVIVSNLNVTNYEDKEGSATAKYQVVTRVNGQVTETSSEVTSWGAGKKFLSLKLNRPAGGIISNWKNTSDVEVGPTTKNYAYYPNDMSVGDVDGDGQYEFILKWESTHAQDNSRSLGYTGNTFIDCYKLDFTKEENCQLLWRIDLGKNIRDGAHYTQFMVYDFDGDGKAELMCKTATGSKDGEGNYVNQAATDAAIKGHDNTKDYRNSGGHILQGPEYLTVFEGATGKAIHTTWYLPGRAGTGAKTPSGTTTSEGGCELGKVSTYPNGFWGDNYGNRSERFLGAVAYVNGADQRPCGIFCRGYYTQAYVWAVGFDGTRLHTEWLHCSPNATQWLVYATKWDEGQIGTEITVDGDILKRIPFKTAPANTGGVGSSDRTESGIVGSNTLYANGNHNISIADVDGDGADEIIWGSSALNNDGTLLYATGYGHGDAMHVGKMIPDREGLQVFDVHEEKLTAKHGCWDLHDARTGEVIWNGGPAGEDNGRGMAGDLTGKDGYEFWSGSERNPRNAVSGKTVISKNTSVNYRIYWDGSAQDQVFDGSYKYDKTKGVWHQDCNSNPVIAKWNGSSFTNVITFNSSTYNNAQSSNYTKATPCLQADILGDWREELIMWNKNDSSEVMLISTTTPTTYAVPTLMHDHVYRMGVAWQNTAYNQPPHLGYYLPDYINGKIIITGIQEVSEREEENVTGADNNWYTLEGLKLSGKPQSKGLYIYNRKKVIIK